MHTFILLMALHNFISLNSLLTWIFFLLSNNINYIEQSLQICNSTMKQYGENLYNMVSTIYKFSKPSNTRMNLAFNNIKFFLLIAKFSSFHYWTRIHPSLKWQNYILGLVLLIKLKINVKYCLWLFLFSKLDSQRFFPSLKCDAVLKGDLQGSNISNT